jgi:hypothetical protein
MVPLITTDGFLHPRRILEERRLMGRKGFPESYDVPALIGFLADIKAGRVPVSCPVDSHLTYDIVSAEALVIARPDVVILEGLNVLQMAFSCYGPPRSRNQHPTSTGMRRCRTRRPSSWLERSGTRSTAQTSERTSCRHASGRTSSWSRARTTLSAEFRCASSSTALESRFVQVGRVGTKGLGEQETG